MISLLLLALAAAGQNSAVPSNQGVDGVWTNPKGSVQVRTGQCGDKLCGWVVWASEQAKADTLKKGGGPLIGTALLRDYAATGRAHWAGQVYVPDMRSSFGSTITLVDSQTLRVKGCLIGGFICKSQDWRRVTGGSAMAAR
jgi:uncharacterized protein (DUF2147 family)